MKLLTFGLAFVNFYAVSGTGLRKICPFCTRSKQNKLKTTIKLKEATRVGGS
jgi:hypothetical protein